MDETPFPQNQFPHTLASLLLLYLTTDHSTTMQPFKKSNSPIDVLLYFWNRKQHSRSAKKHSFSPPEPLVRPFSPTHSVTRCRIIGTELRTFHNLRNSKMEPKQWLKRKPAYQEPSFNLLPWYFSKMSVTGSVISILAFGQLHVLNQFRSLHSSSNSPIQQPSKLTLHWFLD